MKRFVGSLLYGIEDAALNDVGQTIFSKNIHLRSIPIKFESKKKSMSRLPTSLYLTFAFAKVKIL